MINEGLTVEKLLLSGPVDPIKDPYSVYARLRREQPVLRFTTPLFDGYFVSRFADVRSVLKDDELFSSRSNQERGIGLVMGPSLIGMDGREHRKHRSLITPALAPRAMRGDFRHVVGRMAHALIDTFAAKGAANLVADFTFLYPLRVFTEILGLPPSEVARFHNWAIDLTHVARDPKRGLEASERMKQYLEPLIEQRRATPADDLVSTLATAEVDGARLSDLEVVSFIRLLVIAGAETTYHLLGSALFAMLSEPDLLEAVSADHSLIDLVLEETLRWESPVQILTREATSDTSLAGEPIRGGQDVIVCIGSANRDETVFARPEQFDVARDPNPHLLFGFGIHYCLGANLARLEMRVMFEELFARYEAFESTGPASWTRENRLLGLKHLPVRMHPRTTS